MGFGNGYDSGYSDAIEDVRNGKVAGLGLTDGSSSNVPGAFDAGVLEGYDVEKLLSADGLSTYLATLSDSQLKGLVSNDSSTDPLNIESWGNIFSYVPSVSDFGRLGVVFSTILYALGARGILSDNA